MRAQKEFMNKSAWIFLTFALALTSCRNTYNQMLKSTDYDFKYECGKQFFAEGKYTKAMTLLEEVVTLNKNTERGEENLYMLGMCEFGNRDYETASEYFKKYTTSYPRGRYIENAHYFYGFSLYKSTPEPRLDQTSTYAAIKAFQDFIDLFPEAEKRDEAQTRMFELQDKLVVKEYLASKMYYDMGTYFGNCSSGGNNYESCIVTAQNAIKDYPYMAQREDFAILIMKAKYHLATMSVEEKKIDRYRDAEDECYGFLNEYPDSKETGTAEKYIARCKKVLNEK